MNMFSRAAAAAFALALASGGAADAAPKKKKTAPSPAPVTLSAAETKAGLSRIEVAGKAYAMRGGFMHVCTPDNAGQVVVPLSVAYEIAGANHFKVPAAERARVIDAISTHAKELLGAYTANRAAFASLQSPAGTLRFTQRLMDFGHGIGIGAKMNLVIYVNGNIVPAEGCGTITNRAAYDTAMGKYHESLRQTRTPEAKWGPI